jgi:hypothetical protein
MRRIKMLEYALRVERFVLFLSSALSMDVTCLTRTARNNSHNPPLSHPSRHSPQRWPLCNLLPRRTRHLATRKVVVLALLVAKVFPFSIHPLLSLTRSKTLPYPQKGGRMVPPLLVQRGRVRGQGHHRRGGRIPMALPQLLPLENHHLAVTPRVALAVGTTLNSTPLA